MVFESPGKPDNFHKPEFEASTGKPVVVLVLMVLMVQIVQMVLVVLMVQMVLVVLVVLVWWVSEASETGPRPASVGVTVGVLQA